MGDFLFLVSDFAKYFTNALLDHKEDLYYIHNSVLSVWPSVVCTRCQHRELLVSDFPSVVLATFYFV